MSLELGSERWPVSGSSPLVNLMMSPWVTLNMIHDFLRKSSLILNRRVFFAVSMETDLAQMRRHSNALAVSSKLK